MRSHRYDFTAREATGLLVRPFIPLLILAALLHLGVSLRALPRSRPALDMDRTILVHQAESSQTRHDAAIVLIGDSSCMMDVFAPQLQAGTGQATLNLGTLSYLDLNSYGAMLRQYFKANLNNPQAVVLLVHPEWLRRLEPVQHHVQALQCFYEQRDCCASGGFFNQSSCYLGLEILRGRVLSRLLPVPLPGEYGQYYGFTVDLSRYLTEHQGSGVDPRKFISAAGQGNAEYRISPQLESSSQRFREALPRDVKLLVGITPVPAGFAPPQYHEQHARMLQQWGEWLRADTVLTNLPPVLPDEAFASVTHLSAEGARTYTQRLGASLAPLLTKSQP